MTTPEPIADSSTDSPEATTDPTSSPLPGPNRDAAYWAAEAGRLKVGAMPAGAVNINVDGRRVVGPLQGFGPMWQKTYSMPLVGAQVTPAEVIQNWKANFPRFWPKGNRFYPSLTGIAPGEVALLRLSVGGMPLSTGVMVLYADEESFTLMTPEGHAFAGWITFSAYEQDGATVAQAQVLMRANDPLYEIGMTFGGHAKEDRFWAQTLTALGTRLGVPDPQVETRSTCVDSHRQWRNARNIWHSAMLRSTLQTVAAPLHRRSRPAA